MAHWGLFLLLWQPSEQKHLLLSIDHFGFNLPIGLKKKIKITFFTGDNNIDD
jgi:hypothetical protein